MPVLCLAPGEKAAIAALYKQRYHTQKDLADHFNVSTSTVHAVLRELGVTKKKPQLSVTELQQLTLIREHGITHEQLYSLINPVHH